MNRFLNLGKRRPLVLSSLPEPSSPLCAESFGALDLLDIYSTVQSFRHHVSENLRKIIAFEVIVPLGLLAIGIKVPYPVARKSDRYRIDR